MNKRKLRIKKQAALDEQTEVEKITDETIAFTFTIFVIL